MKTHAALLSRRQTIVGSAAVACALALEALPAIGLPQPVTVKMFYSLDEPWGMFAHGHVPTEQFHKAALTLIEQDSDIRDNTEGWLHEDAPTDDDGNGKHVINAEPEHGYMRLDRIDDPELGDVYVRCKADDPGAMPITVVMY